MTEIDNPMEPITQTLSGDRCEIMVRGRIDASLANRMEIEIQTAMKESPREICINLSEADYICSAGIRVLLQYYRQMKNAQGALWVTRPSPNVESILDMTGFKELIVEKSQARQA